MCQSQIETARACKCDRPARHSCHICLFLFCSLLPLSFLVVGSSSLIFAAAHPSFWSFNLHALASVGGSWVRPTACWFGRPCGVAPCWDWTRPPPSRPLECARPNSRDSFRTSSRSPSTTSSPVEQRHEQPKDCPHSQSADRRRSCKRTHRWPTGLDRDHSRPLMRSKCSDRPCWRFLFLPPRSCSETAATLAWVPAPPSSMVDRC